MTAFDDHILQTGQAAERAGILAEFYLVNQLIMEATGQQSDVVRELATLEQLCMEMLNEVAEYGLTSSAASSALNLPSNLVDGLVPESTFDLWFEALAVRLRRCTTWVAETSGMDTVVLDQLLVIENRYAAVMLYVLTSPMFRGGATPAKPMTNAVAALDAVATELVARDPSAAALVDSVVSAAADALRAALQSPPHRPST